MSDLFVILVLKTVIYNSKLLGFQDCECLNLGHYDPDTDFIDRHYIVCGCGPHSHYLVKYLVKTTGDITISETIKLYEDPEEDGLCVD